MSFENRFGMFIHWGIYAVPAYHEQILARRDMKNDEYEKYARVFDPVLYDPDEWVLMAKRAGMKYICFTTKHHDGFCMWDTKQTDYNIMHTPYGRDVLKMLSEACARHGMALSLYYSNPDWHEPCAYNPLSSHQWKSVDTARGNRAEYIDFVKRQITELLTNYGPIYTLFWDIPPRFEDDSVNQLARSLQPGILINDRGYDAGDFSTPEREVPDGKRFARMTEACQSVGEQSWGYRSNEDYYTPRFLMSSIDRVMAMGGNYLLNAGPMADGTIPAVSRAIIARIGDWYMRVRDSLECHDADARDYGIPDNEYIACRKGDRTFLHFYNGTVSSAVSLYSYPSVPRHVRLLNSGLELPFEEVCLPNSFGSDGIASTKAVHIHDIPVAVYDGEPIVIEIDW